MPLPCLPLNAVRGSTPCTVYRHVIQSDTVSEHTHDHTEIVIVLSGRGGHRQMGVEHPVEPGDVMVLSEGCSHALFDARGLEVANIKFRFSGFRALDEQVAAMPAYRQLFGYRRDPEHWRGPGLPAHLRLAPEDAEMIWGLAHTIEDEVFATRPARDAILRCLIPQLVTELCRRHPAEAAAPTSPQRSPLGHIIAYLEANYQYAEISLPQLARRAGLSVNQFLRVFQKFHACTPMQYLLRCRLEHACVLLSDERLRITQVAYESGFQDSNYFTRQFRQVYGKSPRQYRQTYGVSIS